MIFICWYVKFAGLFVWCGCLCFDLCVRFVLVYFGVLFVSDLLRCMAFVVLRFLLSLLFTVICVAGYFVLLLLRFGFCCGVCLLIGMIACRCFTWCLLFSVV